MPSRSTERQTGAAAHFDEKIAYLDARPEAVESAWALRSAVDTQPELLRNRRTLFVLIDAETGSTGEEFMAVLRQFENALFVGENTKGLIVSGSPAWGTLLN